MSITDTAKGDKVSKRALEIPALSSPVSRINPENTWLVSLFDVIRRQGYRESLMLSVRIAVL
jgi:hypothetical protein